jgi:hypothetical protein
MFLETLERLAETLHKFKQDKDLLRASSLAESGPRRVK